MYFFSEHTFTRTFLKYYANTFFSHAHFLLAYKMSNFRFACSSVKDNLFWHAHAQFQIGNPSIVFTCFWLNESYWCKFQIGCSWLMSDVGRQCQVAIDRSQTPRSRTSVRASLLLTEVTVTREICSDVKRCDENMCGDTKS